MILIFLSVEVGSPTLPTKAQTPTMSFEVCAIGIAEFTLFKFWGGLELEQALSINKDHTSRVNRILIGVKNVI
jgi:hypothetical protein